MSAARLVGFVIATIGFLSGLALVAQPFMAQVEASPLVMGLLFPAGTLLGLILCAGGPARALALRLAGAALTGLGLFALIGIFVDGAGLLPAQRPTLALWLVAPAALSVGLLLHYFAGALERLGPAGR